nr:hypothetical protein [uncultured Draconibacterium sp.]
MKNLIIPLFILVVALISSCSKSELEIDREEIIGVWVIPESRDTLKFTSDQTAYMNTLPFEYQVEKDSIEMRYIGAWLALFLPPPPFKLGYTLNVDELIIDCPNENCYGFDGGSVEYHRVD